MNQKCFGLERLPTVHGSDGGNSHPLPPAAAVYGIDLNSSSIPKRWTNGRTVADFIATFLDLPIVPPYSVKSQADTSTGVNYGFAGCGILPETCSWLPENWSFDDQIAKFNLTVAMNLRKVYNKKQDLCQHLADAIFLISLGTNDYAERLKKPCMEPDVFAKNLLNKMALGLRALYNIGARKFLFKSILPQGCTTRYEIHTDPWTVSCNESVNESILHFNNGLPCMLKNLQSDLSGFLFSYSNDFEFVRDVEENSAKYGIVNTMGECLSSKNLVVCQNRDLYLYYDYVHTTQAANEAFSLNCFNGTLCSPMNIMQLAAA